MTRACSTCAWWTRNASGPFGDCRGAPPTVTDTGYAFPQTHEETWCAAFRLSEELIRSNAHLGPTEILKHFEKPEAAE
jgi:hypothetical protein